MPPGPLWRGVQTRPVLVCHPVPLARSLESRFWVRKLLDSALPHSLQCPHSLRWNTVGSFLPISLILGVLSHLR